MRSVVGIFGLLCGLIVVGLVGRYGYTTTDVEMDAWIVAFLFSAIASGGLFGHAVAVRLWRRSKLTALGVGLVSCAALLLNLSNSLGAIAGRQDTAQQERIEKNRQIRAAEAELKRLTGLRNAMPAFAPTDSAAVSAAQRTADAATRARNAECGNGDPNERGKNCRSYEATENDANNKLVQVTAARAATDKATELETDAKAQRDKLAALGPIVTVNAQGSALAKLFRLADTEAAFAATAQQFGLAMVVELLIVMSMIAWEVMGRAPRTTPLAERRVNFAAPTKPKLAARTDTTPSGALIRIMTAALEPAEGERADFADCYREYAARCGAYGVPALPVQVFAEGLRRFCDACGIRVRRSGNTAYLVNVRRMALANDNTASLAVAVGLRG